MDSGEDEFEVVDAHIHIFSTLGRCQKLNWLKHGDVLYTPHSYAAYQASGTPASSAVFVECDTVIEQDFTAHLEEFKDAASCERVKAIVAWAPMHDMKVLQAYLAKLRSIDTRNLLRGVRVLLQDKPDGHCLDPIFQQCIVYLGQQDLLFEIGINVHSRGMVQLEEALQMIGSCTDTRFILNHLAKPDLTAGVSKDYARLMRRVASHHNVCMKLSGGLTELKRGEKLPNENLAAYVKLNLDLFGPRRLMFGSDWPVLKLSEADSSVQKSPIGWFLYCKQLLQQFGLTSADLKSVFAENVKREYAFP